MKEWVGDSYKRDYGKCHGKGFKWLITRKKAPRQTVFGFCILSPL